MIPHILMQEMKLFIFPKYRWERETDRQTDRDQERDRDRQADSVYIYAFFLLVLWKLGVILHFRDYGGLDHSVQDSNWEIDLLKSLNYLVFR